MFPLSGSCIWLILEEIIRYKGDFRTASIYHRTTLDAEETDAFWKY
jgi:hypothetical protein